MGKAAVHPNQVPVINKVFEKRRMSMLRRAREVLSKFEKLNDGSSVIVNKKGEMMDTPSYVMYKRILDMFEKKRTTKPIKRFSRRSKAKN